LALVNTQEMESAIIIDVLLPWSSQVPTWKMFLLLTISTPLFLTAKSLRVTR
jgi:hypothetical protein